MKKVINGLTSLILILGVIGVVGLMVGLMEFGYPNGDKVCDFKFDGTTYHVYVTDINYWTDEIPKSVNPEFDSILSIDYAIHKGLFRKLNDFETVTPFSLDGENPTEYLVAKKLGELETQKAITDEHNKREEIYHNSYDFNLNKLKCF